MNGNDTVIEKAVVLYHKYLVYPIIRYLRLLVPKSMERAFELAGRTMDRRTKQQWYKALTIQECHNQGFVACRSNLLVVLLLLLSLQRERSLVAIDSFSSEELFRHFWLICRQFSGEIGMKLITVTIKLMFLSIYRGLVFWLTLPIGILMSVVNTN